MFSDKKFGLPKDLIDTVKKVVENNKNNNLNEQEEINEVAGSAIKSAIKTITKIGSDKPTRKDIKMYQNFKSGSTTSPSTTPPSGAGQKDVITGGARKPPSPPSTPPPASAAPSSGGALVPKKDTPIDVKKARETAVDVPVTPLKQKPDITPQKPESNIKKYLGLGAVGAGGIAIGAALTKGKGTDSTTKDSNDPAGTYDLDKNDPAGTYDAAPKSDTKSKPTTPKSSVSAPKSPSIKPTPSTPDMDAPGAVGGSFSRRQASELGFSYEDGGKKKKNMKESFLIKAFLDLQEKKHHKKKLDPVGKEDEDVDNDGDVDSTDKYLKHRREVIAKNIKEEETIVESERLSYHKKMVKKIEKELAEDPRNSHLKEKLSYHKKMVKELMEDVELDKKDRLVVTLKKLHKEEIQLSDAELAHLEAVSDKDEQKITGREGSSRKGPTVPNRDLTD